MTRSEILDEARKIVTTDREESYGKPENNFELIAMFWTDYLQGTSSALITPKDVPVMMALLKVARIATGIRPKPDNYIDLAGYAACAGELALDKDKEAYRYA